MDGGSKDKEKPGLPATYEVGYGKPPVEHRFGKGQSGNPRGRPKGTTNKRSELKPANQPTDYLILEEAYRPVTIREGDHTIELPAIQAAMRSLAISAMKGSRLSQQTMAEMVRAIEARKASENLTILENAFEYKTKWTEELERRKRLGLELPDPIPHPQDVHLNFRTGEVKTDGPLDEREKAGYDERIARRAEAQEEVNYFAAKHRSSRSDRQKTMWLDEWHFEQRIFDIINDSMPKRYKLKLENRSYHPDASREDKTLKEFADDRKRPRSKRKWGDYVED